jgi:hypothetical protein
MESYASFVRSKQLQDAKTAGRSACTLNSGFLLSVPACLDELRGESRLLIAVLPRLLVRRGVRLDPIAVAFAMDHGAIFALQPALPERNR